LTPCAPPEITFWRGAGDRGFLKLKEFGAKLRAARVTSNKTVPEVSAYLISLGAKASEKTIYSWESGRSQPGPDTLLDLCKFYGVSDVLGAVQQSACFRAVFIALFYVLIIIVS